MVTGGCYVAAHKDTSSLCCLHMKPVEAASCAAPAMPEKIDGDWDLDKAVDKRQHSDSQ
jgi:hypothetical protein